MASSSPSSSSSSSSSFSSSPPPSSSSSSSSSSEIDPAAACFHMVLFPYPITGHIRPLVSFGHALVASYSKFSPNNPHINQPQPQPQLRITIIHTEANLHNIRKQDSSINESSPGVRDTNQVHLLSISDGLPLDFDRAVNYPAFFMSIQRMGPALLARLAEIRSQHGHISCLVSDPNYPWILDLARSIDLPCLLFVTDSASAFAASLYARRLHKEGFIGNKGPLPDRPIDFIPGLPGLPADVLPFPPIQLSEFFFELRLSMYDKVSGAAGILINTVYELEKEVMDGINIPRPKPEASSVPIFAVGPCVEGAERLGSLACSLSCGGGGRDMEEERQVLAWLDGKEAGSVVYICFGTFARPMDEESRQIGAALRASRVPYLWAGQRGSVQLKQILDMNGDDEGKDGEGLVVEWAPQTEVLQHRAVGAFLTHCGWNSVMEATMAGTPMICFPFVLDQHMSCRLVVDKWRTGLRLDRGHDLRPRLTSMLSQLVPRPGAPCCPCPCPVRARARELRRKVLDTMRTRSRSSWVSIDKDDEDSEVVVGRPDLVTNGFHAFLDNLTCH